MTEKFEDVTVLGHPMLFTCLRVDRDTVPQGMYMYEVRHDDDQQGEPVQIANWIVVNHWGTLISNRPIRLEPRPDGRNAYRDIDPENDWNYEGTLTTVKEYMEKNPPAVHMFSKRTIKQKVTVQSVDTASEAYALSLAEKARIDMPYMSQLTGKTEQELFEDLKGVIFLNPIYSWYCPNCKTQVAGLKNKKNQIRVICTKCGVEMVRTVVSRRHDVIDMYAPAGMEHSDLELREY